MKVLVSLFLVAGVVTSALAQPVVNISSGKISGKATPTGINVFLGIPYAQNTAGNNRWRPPQSIANWTGTFEADEFGDICTQPEPVVYGPWTEEFLAQGNMSEDCLSLNIWTPSLSKEKLPTLVWIHGGGLTTGASDVPLYDGESLASRDIVVVTFNYRLGIFGFLSHPALDDEQGSSGEYGLLDQVAALKWVKQNIEAFGGDPNNITLAGQSAGAASVQLLMSSPLTEGLFHKAIIQSGMSVGGFLPVSDTDPLTVGVAAQQKLGAENLADMRNTPASELIKMASELRLQGQTRPVRFSPRLGFNFKTQFENSDMPVLTGLTANENSAFGRLAEVSKDGFDAFIERHFSRHAEKLISLYAGDEQDYTEALSNLRRDVGLAAMHFRLQQSDAPQSTFAYLFKAEPPGEPEGYRSFHSGELPYMFANLTMGDRPYDDSDQRLSDAMLSYWLAFISSGDIGNTLLDWPAYGDKRQIMHFGQAPVAELNSLLSDEKLNIFSQIHNEGGRLSIILL